MNDSLDKFRQLYTSERYDEALLVLEEVEKLGFLHPSILVWKSRCLQLTDLPVVELSEIEGLLKKALALDHEYLPALLDLGFFYLRVIDDAQKATPLFEHALKICRDATTEVIVGLTECLAETKSSEAATEFLAKNEKLGIDTKKIEKLRDELKQGLLG